MNNISILGRVTKDIEIITTNSGITLIRFNVAVKKDYQTGDGERDVNFFSCVAWRSLAENIAKYFKKGSMIGLTGSMDSRTYEKDGKDQLVWELNVKSFSFGGGIGEEEPEKPKKEIKGKQVEMVPISDDDLPF